MSKNFINQVEAKDIEDLLFGVVNTSLSGLQVLRSLYDSTGSIVDFEWIIVNDAILNTWGKKREDIVGKTMLTVFPGVKKDGLFDLYVRTANGETLNFIQYYNHDGLDNWFKVRAVKFRDGFILSLDDITKEVIAENELKKKNAELEEKVKERTKQLELQKEHIYSVLLQAPAMVAILQGDDLIFELANPLFLKVTGKTKSIIGLSVLEAMPEIKGQPIAEILFNVYKKGERYTGNELLVPLDINNDGIVEDVYFNFVYEPYQNTSGKTEGILVHAVDVTNQVITRKKAEESEARLKAIIDATPEFIQIISPDGTLEYMNASGLTIMQGDEELLGKAFVFEVVAEEYRQDWIQKHNRICQGEKLNWQFDIIDLKGNRHRLETHAVPLPGANGVSQLAVTRDITERYQIEEALKSREQQLTAIFDQTSVGIAQLDLKGNFLLVNDGFCQMVGRSKEELYKMSTFQITHPDDYHKKELEQIIVNGESHIFEKRYIRPDGSVIWVNINVTAIKDNEGQVQNILGVSQDITEWKYYEQTLRESEERFHNLADTAPIYLAMADDSGNAIYFNKPWLDWTGRTMEEMKGLGWLCTLHPEDAPKFEQEFKNAFEKQIPISEQYRFRKANGEYRWLLAVGAPRFTPDGRFVGYFGTYADFHDLKKVQDDLKHKNEELIKINNDLDNFIYTASHDLKVPISNMEGLLNALLIDKQSISTDDSSTILAMLGKSVLRLKGTISELTKISQIQKNLPDETETIDIKEIIEEFKEDYKEQINQENVELKLQLDMARMIFSRKNIRSIIYNLLSNAIKYKHPNRYPEIYLKTQSVEGYILLTVEDNGLGIEETDKEKIFTMFKRMHTHVEGTGVGLYIIKRIIENNGGFIKVDTQVDKGTTFKVYIKQ